MVARSQKLVRIAVFSLAVVAGMNACGSTGGGSGGGGGGSGPGTGPSTGGGSNSDPLLVCDAPLLCSGSMTYKYCHSATQCEYQTSDGQHFACSCGQCDSAKVAAQAACAGGSGSPDMSVGPDLSGGGGGLLGCNGYIDCLSSEYASNGGDFQAAEMTCKGLSTTNAPTLWETAIGCGQAYCLGQTGSPAKCKLNAAQTQLVNLDDTAPGDGTPCGDCLANALAAPFKEACPQPTSVDCNPTACQSDVNACLNDQP